MTFTPKNWGDFTAGGTPLNAAALEDLETRVTDYSDSVIVPVVTAPIYAVTSGTAVILADVTAYPMQTVTLTTATPAITLPTATAGQGFTLFLLQDATGSRAPTWVGTVKWPGGASPALTGTANALDVVSFICRLAGTWLGFPAGYDLR